LSKSAIFLANPVYCKLFAVKGNILASQGIAHGVEISPSKGRKIQPPSKVVLTTHFYHEKWIN